VLAAIRSGRNVREGLLSLHIDGDPLIKPAHVSTFLGWLADQLAGYAAADNHVVHKPDSRYCEHCVVLDPLETFNF
jgi:hypothetical protein